MDFSQATNLDSFDVLAVRPESDDMFSRCCDRAGVDLISLDLATRGTFMTINPKNVDKVKVRGRRVRCAGISRLTIVRCRLEAPFLKLRVRRPLKPIPIVYRSMLMLESLYMHVGAPT